MIVLKMIGFFLVGCLGLFALGVVLVTFTGFAMGIVQWYRNEIRQQRQPAKRERKKKRKSEVRPRFRVVWPD